MIVQERGAAFRPRPVAPTRWGWDRADTPIDCESAHLLRSCLLPVFQSAESWAALLGALEDKGYGLAFRDGRLALMDGPRAICTGTFLGMPFAELRDRLGPPHVRPLPGRPLCGELTG